jgi:hypothetical protein
MLLKMDVGIVHIEVMIFEDVNGAGICVQMGKTCWTLVGTRVTRSSIWYAPAECAATLKSLIFSAVRSSRVIEVSSEMRAAPVRAAVAPCVQRSMQMRLRVGACVVMKF